MISSKIEKLKQNTPFDLELNKDPRTSIIVLYKVLDEIDKDKLFILDASFLTDSSEYHKIIDMLSKNYKIATTVKVGREIIINANAKGIPSYKSMSGEIIKSISNDNRLFNMNAHSVEDDILSKLSGGLTKKLIYNIMDKEFNRIYPTIKKIVRAHPNYDNKNHPVSNISNNINESLFTKTAFNSTLKPNKSLKLFEELITFIGNTKENFETIINNEIAKINLDNDKFNCIYKTQYDKRINKRISSIETHIIYSIRYIAKAIAKNLPSSTLKSKSFQKSVKHDLFDNYLTNNMIADSGLIKLAYNYFPLSKQTTDGQLVGLDGEIYNSKSPIILSNDKDIYELNKLRQLVRF